MSETEVAGVLGDLWELVAFFGAAILVLLVILMIESGKDEDGR